MKPLAFIAFLLSATAAQAQTPSSLTMMCGAYTPLAKMLGRDHGERLLHTGETTGGHEIQQWLNVEGGNWSVVLRDGEIGCLVATGKSFNASPKGKPGEDS